MSNYPATTREQHARGHINLLLNGLDKDLAAVRDAIARGDLTRTEAAVWLRLLVESAGELITAHEAFLARGGAA